MSDGHSSGLVAVGNDIPDRLRRTCRDAALAIETLRSENARLRRVVVDLWDHMDDQACIEFSSVHPNSYFVADEEWQTERKRREALHSLTTSEETDHG